MLSNFNKDKNKNLSILQIKDDITYYQSSNIEFYASELFQRYLIFSNPKKLKSQNTAKLLTLFIWLGKNQILPIHSQKILEERLKELLENFQLKTLSIELVRLLSRLKNHSLKIHILEHLLDLEEKFQNTPTEGFFFTKLNALASQIKALNNQIKMMETERSLKELKYTAYDFKTAAEKINFILEHLAA